MLEAWSVELRASSAVLEAWSVELRASSAVLEAWSVELRASSAERCSCGPGALHVSGHYRCERSARSLERSAQRPNAERSTLIGYLTV